MTKIREIEEFKEKEKKYDQTRIKEKRENEEFRQKESEKDREKKANDNYMKNNDFGLLIAQYNNSIKEGPTWICVCGGGL